MTLRTSKNGLALTIMVSLCIAVIAGYFFFVFYIRSQGKDIMELREAAATGEQKKKEQTLLAANSESAEMLKAKLASHLVSRADIVSFITTLENIGQNAGSKIVIDSITINPEEAASSVVADGVLRVSVQGSWREVTRTLLLVENIPYVANITTLRLEQLKTDGDAQAVAGAVAAAPWRANFELVIRTIK